MRGCGKAPHVCSRPLAALKHNVQSKRGRLHDDKDLPADKRFRENVKELLVTNALSAPQFQRLVDNANAGGIRGVADLDSHGRANKGGWNLNARLRTKFLKGSLWPKQYLAKIRCWCPKKKVEHLQWMAFGLPHEYIAQLVKYGDLDKICDTDGLDAISKRHLAKCMASVGAEMVPLGLWADGVPCQWDRDQTIEILTLNLPGLSRTGEHRKIRLPVAVIMKTNMSQNTWDDIFSIVLWSFRHMATGVYPSSRNDGSPWLASERQRSLCGGKQLGYQACLVQMRADWACWKQTWKFPMWNEKAGCCWRCGIKPDEAVWLFENKWPNSLRGTGFL